MWSERSPLHSAHHRHARYEEQAEYEERKVGLRGGAAGDDFRFVLVAVGLHWEKR